MDVTLLARLQFALTIGFHYIYPPLSIGLGLIMVIIEAIYLKTGNIAYRQMAKFWTKVFALTFSLGVATGVVMEFEFGTNWATYSKYVGDIFGSALGAEGIFAFFLESGFLALLLFGWDKVSKGLHFFSTCMVCLGAHFSAIWIVVANSWMQTPAGYKIVGEGLEAKAQITDFWAMVFNPSSIDRLIHTILGSWIYAACLVLSISAWYMLKKRHRFFAQKSMQIGLAFAGVSLGLQLLSGHSSAILVSKYQPAKMAAFEGLYETQSKAPLAAFGWTDPDTQTTKGIMVPGMLSFMIHGDVNKPVIGLNQIPKDQWPPVKTTFHTYHLMIALWGILSSTVAFAFWKMRKQQLENSKVVLWGLVFSVGAAAIANQSGWICAEVGRQPWIVWQLLRTSDALSKAVTANMVLGSLIFFGLIYLLLFALFIFLLNAKIQQGPSDSIDSAEYRDPLKNIQP